jgi:sugar lactone lactonase YvrE
MMKRIHIVVLFMLLLSVGVLVQAQNYKYNATLDTLKGNGLIVDHQGRIWYQSNADSLGIRVMNPNGTFASFSPIFSVTIADISYNVGKGATGMNIFPDGNILVACGGALYKINAETGEGIARWEMAGIGRPAVDGEGNVYVVKVVGPAAIWKLDKDFTTADSIANNLNWTRGIEISQDGKDLYAGSLWQHVVSHFHTDDGFEYTLDTLLDASVITGNTPILKFDRKGLLWIGQEVDAGTPTFPIYAYDITEGKFVDSLISPEGDNTWKRPRGLDFSLSGDTLYVIDFDTGLLQEWIKEAPAASLFDDFEDGDTVNTYGGSWQKTDGMAGTLTSEIAAGGYNGSSHSLHITGSYTNWAGIEATMNAEGTALDLSAYKGIRFAVKAVAVDTLRIKVREQKRVDNGSYEFAKYDFLPTADWTVVTIPFDMLVSMYSGVALDPAFDAADITQIDFEPFKTNTNGDFYIDDIQFVATITAVKEKASPSPVTFELSQNYPNPFNPSTTIEFKIAASGHSSLKVFDILGKEVASLVNENLSAGTYSVRFDASRLASGIYFYQLKTSSLTETKKMLLMR